MIMATIFEAKTNLSKLLKRVQEERDRDHLPPDEELRLCDGEGE
jgi:hypothetical protein